MLNKHLPKFITLSLSVTLALVGLICMLGLLGRLSQVAHAQGGTGTIYVNPGGTDSVGCGGGTPCRTIKYALDNEAQYGDVIIVADGTYTDQISMQPGVVISGAGADVTFVDGEGIRGPLVSAGSGVTESAVLRGFTIQNGKNNLVGGGGINISSGSPLIENCTISHNLANGQSGGGLFIGGSPTLSNNVIFDNESTGSGGGIYIGGGSPILVFNTIYSNTTFDWGGGIYKWDGSAILRSNTIYSNTGPRGGGGIYNYDGPLTLQNNMIHRNRTAGGFDGGGVYIVLTNTVILENNTIYSNTAENGFGGGIYVQFGSPVISNSIVVSNTGFVGGGIAKGGVGAFTIDYNNVWGNVALSPGTDNYYAVTAGVHSISSDPKFVDATNSNFHLNSGSPCINSGDPNTSLNSDFEGNKRPSGSGYDMGAYEYQSGADTYLPIVIKN